MSETLSQVKHIKFLKMLILASYQELAAAGMDVDIRRRKVPKGTSEYQAAWILDDFEGDSEEEAETLEAGSGSAPASKAASQGPTEEDAWDEDMEMDDTEVGFQNPEMSCEKAYAPENLEPHQN